MATRDPVLTVDDRGLYCPAGRFHVDPWQPAPVAVITHAHGDHARAGSAAYHCTAPSERILRHRLPDAVIHPHPYGEPFTLGDAKVSFHPSGHVLGAAQVRIAHDSDVWVVSGDYKRAPDPTCPAFEPVRCDTFITEATFALPIFHWDPPEETVREIFDWWERNRAAGKAALLFCYTLGKAERVLAELTRHTDRRVFVHGAMAPMIDAYRAEGIPMLPTALATEQKKGTSFAGELVLAPISARGNVWLRRFKDREEAFVSGWMRLRGTRRRRAFDRGFSLSDHADWPALLRTVEESGARRILVTHGYAQPFARALQERGYDAQVLPTHYAGEEED